MRRYQDPKSEKGRRTPALAHLVKRYREWISKKKITDPEAWIFVQEDAPGKLMWDSCVRKVLHTAAKAEG